MRRVVAAIALLSFGCTTTVLEQVPVIPKIAAARPETIALPEDPAARKLPENTPPGDFTFAVSKDKPASRDGVCLSEERAIRDGFYRLGYKELRVITEADRKVFAAQRELYEALIGEANIALEKASYRSWWDKHKGEVMFFGGFILGVTATVGIAKAVQ